MAEAGQHPEKRGSGRRNEIAMGVAVVTVILVLFFGIRFLEDRPVFSGTYELVSEFDHANGLLAGSPVTISGVQVGEVSDVELLNGAHRVRVGLRIRDDVAIPVGSHAMVEGFAALDNVAVSIRPGSGSEALGEGAVLPGTKQPSLVERVDTTLAGAQKTLGEVESLVSGTERDLSAVLANMRVASSEAAGLLQGERERLHATVADLRSTASELDEAAAQFNRVAQQGGDSLVAAMDQMNAVMRRLDSSVRSIERSSSSLESVIAQVESGQGTLGRFVYDASLYARLDSAAMRLDAILAEFQNDPGKYLEQLELVDIF